MRSIRLTTRASTDRGERGAVAGLEGVVFGVLILVAGTIVVVNAWSVLQTRRALDGAAREYLRAYTESESPDAAITAGRRSLDAVLSGERRGGLHASQLRLEEPDPSRFGPCADASVVLSVEVPAARVPFIGEVASTTVRVAHTEMIDAHREVRTGATYDPGATPCGS